MYGKSGDDDISLKQILNDERYLDELIDKKIDTQLRELLEKHNIPVRDGVRLIISIALLAHVPSDKVKKDAVEVIKEIFLKHRVSLDSQHEIMDYISTNYPVFPHMPEIRLEQDS